MRISEASVRTVNGLDVSGKANTGVDAMATLMRLNAWIAASPIGN